MTNIHALLQQDAGAGADRVEGREGTGDGAGGGKGIWKAGKVGRDWGGTDEGGCSGASCACPSMPRVSMGLALVM